MYRRRKPVIKEKPPIPNTLDEFGYVLKENGEIRSKDTDEVYLFDYLPKDRPYNEKRYDKFIELIGDEVEKQLQSEPYNFQKLIVPIDANPKTDAHSYIYTTPNALTTKDKLLIMIPGNNTRIGQWSKRVLCDETIKSGSMMQITDMVKEHGYEAIILNPNANFWYNGRAWETPEVHTTKLTVVPENETPEMHCEYVFHHVIRNAQASKIAVIAMGWGGYGFTLALNNDFDFIKERVKAVAMVNSVHTKDMINGGSKRTFMFDNCVNWVVSQAKKGEIVTDIRSGCTCISSEEEIADFTLNKMLDDIMKFIYVKMGDIEPEIVDEDEADEIEELTQEEIEELKNVDLLSID
ncbi:Arb2 domain-containing protein [Cokeromyces recurvatus]|uniref:Arb2 domain-containing protein n=1 Tax=Cokeromyces recurvatus TaxID=90255 RepID=UPI00221F0AB6|nr:Arb2 domain-containing protein [Cokeromyces recurvatus]KAI7903576.1 Arb2 domain-containing protein [Cokeromyces recurvatus]